jgi:hypothetical protein
VVEHDFPVHSLKLRPNAPFKLREDAQAKARREQQVAQWKEYKKPKTPPSPGRGDGIKPAEISTLS